MSRDGGTDATARPGGTARGGVAPREDDPDTPARARARQRPSAEAHRAAGFGDDKGGDAE